MLTTPIDDLVGDRRRRVVLERGHNMRDLGGYVTGDGRTIGWGRLYRAGSLSTLSPTDLATFDALGIRTVIDLRSEREVAERGVFDVAGYPVAFHHLPVIDATWQETEVPEFDESEDGIVEFLVWAYRSMLAEGGDRFAHAIGLLAVPGNLPAVFHCAAGKDRTGLLAALVLGGLGVDDEAIALDYGLSEGAMQAMLEWASVHDPERVALMSQMPAAMLAARPAAMREILAGLRDDHGSVAGYLTSIGVSTAMLAALASALDDRDREDLDRRRRRAVG